MQLNKRSSPEQTLPRRRGRRDAAVSKEKIIRAAIQEFALKGLDGARVDEVARRSGVNKTLLYHHIGNKDQLFTAALEATYQTIRSRQRQFLIPDLPPDEGLRRLVQLLMAIWVEYPEFSRLLVSENFHGGKHVKKSKLIQNMYNPLVGTLNELLTRGFEQGLFRKGIDPIDLYISISALSAYYTSHHHTLDAIFRTNLMSPRRLRQREHHIIDMILRYVYLRPDEASANAADATVSKRKRTGVASRKRR